jgi:hypothetical protein
VRSSLTCQGPAPSLRPLHPDRAVRAGRCALVLPGNSNAFDNAFVPGEGGAAQGTAPLSGLKAPEGGPDRIREKSHARPDGSGL